MKQFEWFGQTSDGGRLYTRLWEPEGEITGVVCLIHGHGDHSGRYAGVAAALAEGGYATLAFDHYGHGKSPGQRGHIASYDRFLDEVDWALAEAERRYPGRPRFLYGQSMGGNIAINYALRRRPPIAGVIATSPWLRLSFAPPAWRLALARAVERALPALPQPSGLETAAISRDPAEVRAYETDPLNHDRITPRLFLSCDAAGSWALAHAAEFPLPLLLIHGSADRVTSPEASRKFAALAPNCTYQQWEGGFHELHNEPERTQVLGYIRDWLKTSSRNYADVAK